MCMPPLNRSESPILCKRRSSHVFDDEEDEHQQRRGSRARSSANSADFSMATGVRVRRQRLTSSSFNGTGSLRDNGSAAALCAHGDRLGGAGGNTGNPSSAAVAGAAGAAGLAVVAAAAVAAGQERAANRAGQSFGMRIMRRSAPNRRGMRRGSARSGGRRGGSMSVAEPSVEDAECASIIKAAIDRVTEHSSRNPSPPPSDVDTSVPTLPTVQRPKMPDLRCITPDTLRNLMDGKYQGTVAHFHIIDCRFDYEFEGGHIRDAIHLKEPHEAISRFFKEPPVPTELPVCLIFHCEFSKNRAPKM